MSLFKKRVSFCKQWRILWFGKGCSYHLSFIVIKSRIITCYCSIRPGRHFPWQFRTSIVRRISNPDKGKGQDIFIYLDRVLVCQVPKLSLIGMVLQEPDALASSHHNCVLRHKFHNIIWYGQWRVWLRMFSRLPRSYHYCALAVISFGKQKLEMWMLFFAYVA